MRRADRLVPGCWGDLIAVAGDSLSDLALLSRAENIRLVVKCGEVVKSCGAG